MKLRVGVAASSTSPCSSSSLLLCKVSGLAGFGLIDILPQTPRPLPRHDCPWNHLRLLRGNFFSM
ncbi:BnaC02g29590D [Brassica napus]|uniref:BnaC02g29590D protein n=1 Tax=Brassica napus TaxID=3708 RepID=A0A078GF00_BRANA|nr:BnaC02g29590D [Brassica napus]